MPLSFTEAAPAPQALVRGVKNPAAVPNHPVLQASGCYRQHVVSLRGACHSIGHCPGDGRHKLGMQRRDHNAAAAAGSNRVARGAVCAIALMEAMIPMRAQRILHAVLEQERINERSPSAHPMLSVPLMSEVSVELRLASTRYSMALPSSSHQRSPQCNGARILVVAAAGDGDAIVNLQWISAHISASEHRLLPCRPSALDCGAEHANPCRLHMVDPCEAWDAQPIMPMAMSKPCASLLDAGCVEYDCGRSTAAASPHACGAALAAS